MPGPAEQPPRLGFGCAGLGASRSAGTSEQLVRAAHDAGFRHFDVARSYGYGAAEEALAPLLRTADDVTVTTKLGIVPPARSAALDLARGVARRAVQVAPGLRRRLRARAESMVHGGAFDVPSAVASFDASRRALGVDRVDVLLLHECAPADLTDELLEQLRRWRDDGAVGRTGIATGRDHTDAILATAPEGIEVVQVPDVLGTDPGPPGAPGAWVLTHSVLAGALPRLREVVADPGVARRWGDALGVDATDPAALAGLLLAAGLARNAAGTVLVSSSRPTARGSPAAVTTAASTDAAEALPGRPMPKR